MFEKSNNLILIIDDSVDSQALLKILLTVKGYKVHCASNGREALDILTELSTLPDLILLDSHMPVMDGHEFRVQQGKNTRIKDIPVVVMTGDDDELLIREEMMQPQGILFKPLHTKSLVESISNCIGKKSHL